MAQRPSADKTRAMAEPNMSGLQLTSELGLDDRYMALVLLMMSPARLGGDLQLADRAEQLGETLVRQGLSTAAFDQYSCRNRH